MTDSKSSMLLNINPEGFLRLNVGDTYEIRPERIYFDENQDKYSNYFVPKYRYKAINFGGSNSSVVSFDGDLMRADKEGTAVVLVTYEAVYSDYLNIQGMKGRMLGACLPEDTGVFVVTAGPSAGPDINVTVKGNLTSDRSAGNHFDSDLDYVYYSDELVGGTMTLSNNSGKFTQYNPVYKNGILKSFKDTSANDGRSVKMTSYNGPNIVACTLNGLTSYQVIKAAGVNISVRDLDIPSDNYVIAGDRISVKVTGLNSLLTSRFYNSEKVVVMKVFGEEYVSDPEGSFGIITVPDSYTSGTMKPVFYLRASGNCQEFGSHRGTETPVAERTADFGFFVIHTIFQHDSRIINLDSMIEPDSGSVISAESGLQGKTVDLGTIEIPAGKKIFIEIDRKSPQKFYGIKSLSGAGAWLTEDSGKSGRDCIVLSAEPSAEDTGEYPIKIVINLKNTKGTMKTSVTATLKVVDSFRIQSLKYVSYDGILLPTVPESVHIPDDQAFRGWNTASD
ncbi:MAG: hypothetical protein J5494_07220, partial [Candidatus Methanomethylophilaceae archaeon]|nr:hypothetical protein [Candidatus Methanomethylophilaceae archaeon]